MLETTGTRRSSNPFISFFRKRSPGPDPANGLPKAVWDVSSFPSLVPPSRQWGQQHSRSHYRSVLGAKRQTQWGLTHSVLCALRLYPKERKRLPMQERESIINNLRPLRSWLDGNEGTGRSALDSPRNSLLLHSGHRVQRSLQGPQIGSFLLLAFIFFEKLKW